MTAVGNLGPARLNLMARDSFKTLYYGARVLVIVIQNGPANFNSLHGLLTPDIRYGIATLITWSELGVGREGFSEVIRKCRVSF